MFGHKIVPKFNLPDSLELREDRDFLYVYCDEALVGIYRHSVDIFELLDDCKRWLKRNKKEGLA